MLDIEIREQLARYLANEISLEEFQGWFVPATWNVEQTNNPIAAELAHEIELRLAEFSNGHWTEDDLRSLLGPLVENYTVRVSFGTASPGSSVSLPTSTGAQTEVQFQLAGKLFGAVSS